MANGMGSLYVGNSGLQSAQNAINATANNISNLDTTGYVRQQVLFSDRTYVNLKQETAKISMQQSGLGVTIGDVVHSRDVFLDKYYRSEKGRNSFYQTCYDTVDEVHSQLQEMDGKAFQEVISDLNEAFSELSKDPGSAVNQNLLIQKSTLFVERAQALYKGLNEYQLNMNAQITDGITKINEYGKKIDELNTAINSIESGATETAMDLRDQRDNYLDLLAAYANISYSEDANGIVSVKLEGTAFVDEAGVHEMEATKDSVTGFVTPTWKELNNVTTKSVTPVFSFNTDISTELNTDIGKLKALVMNRGTEISNYLDIEGLSEEEFNDTTGLSVMQKVQAQVDQLTHKLVTTVNDLFSPLKDATITVGGETKDVRIWDQDKGTLGNNMTGPGAEVFTRQFVDRYTKVTGDDGNTYYVYNEESTKREEADTTSLYSVMNLVVNPVLTADETQLPHLKTNGEVDYALGKTMSSLWEAANLTISPGETTPCTFATYYEKMVGSLATTGSIYSSVSTTLSSSVSSIQNQRQNVFGVSSDEELTNMIKYQNAYNAASRYVNVIDQMIEHLVTQLGA